MTDYTVKRLALVFAIQEGMKSLRHLCGECEHSRGGNKYCNECVDGKIDHWTPMKRPVQTSTGTAPAFAKGSAMDKMLHGSLYSSEVTKPQDIDANYRDPNIDRLKEAVEAKIDQLMREGYVAPNGCNNCKFYCTQGFSCAAGSKCKLGNLWELREPVSKTETTEPMTTTKDPDHIAYGPAKSTNLGRQEPDPNVSSPTKSIGQVNNVIKILVALGYDPKHNEEKHDIYFTSFGFEAFTEIHKKVIRVLLGKQLSEFYYGGINTQHIYYRPIPTIQRLANESVVQSEPVSKPETTKPMTVEECGIIAVEISESIEPKLTAPQQAFFIAGFQECFKWISGNKQHQPKLTKRECPEWIKTCKDCDYGKCYPVEPMTAEEALGTFPVIRHHEISEEEMHDYYFPQEVIDFANQFASQQVAAKDREIAELKAEIERLKRTVQSYSDALCDPDIH